MIGGVTSVCLILFFLFFSFLLFQVLLLKQSGLLNVHLPVLVAPSKVESCYTTAKKEERVPPVPQEEKRQSAGQNPQPSPKLDEEDNSYDSDEASRQNPKPLSYEMHLDRPVCVQCMMCLCDC